METSNIQIKTASTQNPDERKCSVSTDNKPEEVNRNNYVVTRSG